MAVSTKGIRAGRAYVELFADSTLLVRGLKRAERRIRRFGGTLQSMGKRLLALSGAFAIPFVVSAKVFAAFETQLAEVSTLLDDAGQFMDGFRKAIRSMAAEFGQSTETLARGLFDIISAMIPAQEALGVLRVAAKLATAGLTETGIATDAITTILNAYSLSAKHAADVSDLFFQTAKRGKTTVADLAPNIGKVATLAATAGLSLEEFGAALASLTRVGLKTEDATTALKAILKSFLKPAKDSADKARELGFELNTAAIKAEGLAGIFERLRDLSPEDIAILFPNIRAIVGVFPLLRQLEGFKEDLRVLTDRAGATEVAFQKLAGTLSFAFRQIRESGTAVLSLIGEALADDIRKVTKRITELLKIVEKWVAGNKGLIVGMAKAVVIVGGLGAALLVLGTAMIGLTGISGLVSTAFALIVVPLTLVSALIGTLIGLFGALLKPLAVLVSLVGLAGAKFLDWEKIVASVTAFVEEKFEGLRAVAEKTFQGVLDAFKAGDLTSVSKIIWATVKLAWTKGTTEIETLVLNFWDRITVGAEQGLAGLPTIIQNVLGLMKTAWTEFTAFVLEDWADVLEGMAERWLRLQRFLTRSIIRLKRVLFLISREERLELEVILNQDFDEALAELKGETTRETLDEKTQRRKIEQHERAKPPLQTVFFTRAGEKLYRDALAAWQKAADELGELPRERRRVLAEPSRPQATRDRVEVPGAAQRRLLEERIAARRRAGDKKIANAQADLDAANREALRRREGTGFPTPTRPTTFPGIDLTTKKQEETRVVKLTQAIWDAGDGVAEAAIAVAAAAAAAIGMGTGAQEKVVLANISGLQAMDTAKDKTLEELRTLVDVTEKVEKNTRPPRDTAP